MENMPEGMHAHTGEDKSLLQSLIDDPLHPYGKPCVLCSAAYSDDDWGYLGWAGILPVSFCPDCSSAMSHMVLQTMTVDSLEEYVEERKVEERKREEEENKGD